MKAVLFFDGGSRGNPGISGCGYVIYVNNEKVTEGCRFISKNGTNNEAEYSGLIDGLKSLIELDELKIIELEIRGDSKLVLQQVQNKWKVKAPNLKPFHQEATKLIKEFTTESRKITFKHIPRSENKEADLLANKGMDSMKQT